MMRRLAVIVLVLFCCGLAYQPSARADSSLSNVVFNVNGATQTDFSNSVGATFNTASYNATTGIGTLTFTFNPGAAGTYYVDALFNLAVSVPFFNEYGTATGGPASGQTWEIGDFGGDFGTIVNDVYAGGNLSNTNMLPGTQSNFGGGCSGANCNGDAAMAMGFQFTLTGSQEAVITYTFSTTNPGGPGLVLDQTHPVDPDNLNQSDVFFIGSEVTQPAGPPPVPEPSTLLLLGVGVGVLCITKTRK